MTDPDLLAKKLARIETCVRELRTQARPGDIARDVLANRLDDLLAFVAEIRTRLDRDPT